MGYNRRSVAHEKCVEVERQHGLEAVFELEGIVHHLFRQEPAASWRVSNHRVADDQQLALLPKQPDFARRLSRDADHLQRTDALADLQGVVDFENTRYGSRRANMATVFAICRNVRKSM